MDFQITRHGAKEQIAFGAPGAAPYDFQVRVLTFLRLGPSKLKVFFRRLGLQPQRW